MGYIITVAVAFGDVIFELDMDPVSVSSNVFAYVYSFLETELSA
jgi:hypothetical protein